MTISNEIAREQAGEVGTAEQEELQPHHIPAAQPAQALAITYYPDLPARLQDRSATTWAALIQQIAAPHEYLSKQVMPLLKMARFGDTPTARGSLRHDGNILAVSGIEGDYDGGKVSLEIAAGLLALHGIEAALYSTPSHTPQAPRWRVACPLSCEHLPASRRDLVARLNGALGGILAPESFTLSQAYYFGKVAGTVYEWRHVAGQCVDRLPGLPVVYPAPLPVVPAAGDSVRVFPEGMRNATLTAAAGHMRRAGFDGPAILTALTGMNEKECVPPLDSWEVEQIAASISRYAPEPQLWEMGFGVAPLPPGAIPIPPGGLQAPAGHRAPRVSVVDVLTSPPAPQRFYIDGILPAGVLTLLGAHGGAGKSILALQAAVSLALGRAFMGLLVERCRVLFFSGEDPAPVVRRRLHRICTAWFINPHDLDGWLLVLDATERPVLYTAAGPTVAYAELQEEVTAFAPGVLIVDNASDTFDANEIERARVREFIRLLVALGKPHDAAVLLLAHVDKATARAGGSAEGYSGSTAWHNSARSRLFLTGADGRLTLEHQKSNLGRLADPIHLAWTPEGLLISTGAPGNADDRSAVLRLIAEAHERGDHVSPSPTSPTNAWAVLSVLPDFPAGLQRKDLNRIMASLESAGEIMRGEILGPNRHSKLVYRPVALTALTTRQLPVSAISG